MANAKTLITAKIATGATVYCIVARSADWYKLDDSDGSFASSPADPYISLAEDSLIKGMYGLNESRAAWDPGRYFVAFYEQSGGSPAPASDNLRDSTDFYVIGDQICTNFPYEYGAVVADGANSAISFVTNLLSSVDSYCRDSFLKFASGTLINQQRKISAYNGTSKLLTLSSAFTTTPSAGDEFFIINQ